MRTKSLTTKLELNNIQVRLKTKTILNGVSGYAKSGNLLAVMGPTGSGKTTLLNAIAGKVPIMSGELTLDGIPFTKSSRRCLAYAMQNDIFLSNLTLWEALYFTAMIRIPEHVPKEEKLARIEEVVDALGIRKCLHTVIGDMFKPGLSGGEKKRANIACELLTDPDIMLVDEPTSGLDSSTAHTLMVQLRNYATHYNKTIIATIHQPSSQIYHMFCTVLLLVNGQLAYFGDAHLALKYFERIGLYCGPHYNPADFLLETLKSDEETVEKIISSVKQIGLKEWLTNDSVKTEISSHKDGHINNFTDTKKTIINITMSHPDVSRSTNLTNGDTGQIINGSMVELVIPDMAVPRCRWPTSLFTQYRLLTWRNFKQAKGRILELSEVVHVVICAALAGMIYFQINHSIDTVRDRMGVIFFSLVFWGFNFVLSTVAGLQSEKGVISKERSSGAYRLSAYYLAKMTSELPLIIIMPIVFHTAMFWMSGLSTVDVFFPTLAILLLHCLIAQSFGFIFGSALSNFKITLITANTFMVVSLIYGGFFTQHYPDWLQWSKYLSIVHYPFGAISILVFKDMEPLSCNVSSIATYMYQKCHENNTQFLTGSDILLHSGVDLPIYCYLSSMAILLIILRLIGYYILSYKRN